MDWVWVINKNLFLSLKYLENIFFFFKLRILVLEEKNYYNLFYNKYFGNNLNLIIYEKWDNIVYLKGFNELKLEVRVFYL